MENNSPEYNAQPDKPPPSGGGCCSKIATFLGISPEVRFTIRVFDVSLVEVAFGVGRKPRERATVDP